VIAVGDSTIRRRAKSRSFHATQSVINPVMEVLITEVPFYKPTSRHMSTDPGDTSELLTIVTLAVLPHHPQNPRCRSLRANEAFAGLLDPHQSPSKPHVKSSARLLRRCRQGVC
jgi:hypothetical protein